jgi:hypothetical protein
MSTSDKDDLAAKICEYIRSKEETSLNTMLSILRSILYGVDKYGIGYVQSGRIMVIVQCFYL